MSQPRRPALRYHGGKWRLAPWVIGHFPPHACYVEPYGGAAGVLLRKDRSHLEVYNDLDGEVVSFFRVLRDRTDEFIRQIELTPFSRQELDEAFEPAEDDLERARRFYVRAWQSRGGPRSQWRTGWRFQRTNARGKRSVDDWTDTGHLRAIVERLREVQIEHDEALPVIERYDTPDTLFYCDPPYLASTRSDRWGSHAYTHEMTQEDHVELAQVLSEIEGMAIVSGYPSELYDDLYGDWAWVERTAITDARSRATECLWISPAAMDRRLPLFQEVVS